MNNPFKNFFILVCLLALAFLIPLDKVGPARSIWGGVSGAFSRLFEEKISPEYLKSKYEENKIRILVVPGHDNNSVGGQFQGVKESDLNVELGLEIFDFFNQDSRFNVYTVREKGGGYTAWFLEYLDKENAAIGVFRDYIKRVAAFFGSRAIVKNQPKVQHNPAADNVSFNLYAINKLADDYNIDIVLHVYFNDYPTRRAGQSGKYSGFAIYVPEKQLPNYRVSNGLAESVKARLEKYFPVSNFPGEKEGIVEDQQLIAVGSNASRKGASLLIEYGYIYEPQFTHPEARGIIFKSLAEQTYLGIKNFFTN